VTPLDLTEFNRAQLALATALAQKSGQPLSLLTVIEPGDVTTIEAANDVLRERAHGLAAGRSGLIVRRGEVAEQIVQCCLAEGAGLVVMGLRARRRGVRPGAVATAVLAHGQTAVLAVPDAA
jgi:nucleotide-binding universal stress UspA family protein